MAEHVPVNFSAALTSRSTSGCIVLIPVKTGGRLVKYARYYWLLLAESHLTRRPFGSMLQRNGLPLRPAGPLSSPEADNIDRGRTYIGQSIDIRRRILEQLRANRLGRGFRISMLDLRGLAASALRDAKQLATRDCGKSIDYLTGAMQPSCCLAADLGFTPP
jgi:hypothetical protein